jgi:hypothetical protein
VYRPGEGGNDRWFYRDRTPDGSSDRLAPHFCPGFRAADAVLGAMSSFLFEPGRSVFPELRRRDAAGLVLEYDVEPVLNAIDRARGAGRSRGESAPPSRDGPHGIPPPSP